MVGRSFGTAGNQGRVVTVRSDGGGGRVVVRSVGRLYDRLVERSVRRSVGRSDGSSVGRNVTKLMTEVPTELITVQSEVTESHSAL